MIEIEQHLNTIAFAIAFLIFLSIFYIMLNIFTSRKK